MLRPSVVTLALLGLAACELPTEAPHWNQSWIVPGERIAVSVAELLPAGIGLNSDTTAFVAQTDSASASVSLASLCGGACPVLVGPVDPKPAFQDTLALTTGLPTDLVSATLAGGTISAGITHSFNFDPLRPSADPGAERGYLVLRVTSNGSVVAYDSISGDDTAFPGGTTLSPMVPIQAVQVANSLSAELIIYSPQGDATTVDATDSLSITLFPSTVEVSQATVNASGITIDPVSTAADFSDVDSTLVAQVDSGAVLLDVDNPFDVTGTLDVRFQGAFPTIQRTVTVSPGTYVDRIALTGEELRTILSAGTVDIMASGTASATAGTVTVTPTQELVLDARFKLSILVGPGEDI